MSCSRCRSLSTVVTHHRVRQISGRARVASFVQGRGAARDLPALPIQSDDKTTTRHGAGLSPVPLPLSCARRFNERTGTGLNELQYPTDILLLAVLWRLRYKLGFRDVAELLLQRGYEVTNETIRGWEARFAPLQAGQLRAKRRG